MPIAEYKVSISYKLKVIAKVDNREDKHTDRTKTICPDHSIRGIKIANAIISPPPVKQGGTIGLHLLVPHR